MLLQHDVHQDIKPPSMSEECTGSQQMFSSVAALQFWHFPAKGEGRKEGPQPSDAGAHKSARLQDTLFHCRQGAWHICSPCLRINPLLNCLGDTASAACKEYVVSGLHTRKEAQVRQASHASALAYRLADS